MSVRSANDRIRLACVGVRGRGRDHIKEFSRLPRVEIAAVCDVDGEALRAGVRRVESRGGRPAACSDIRRLLEDKSIDAVSIATPNHWHALATVWACQAGKDVYVEKPCSHNVAESRQVVAAARRYERIVQHGTQCRSSAALQQAVRLMREGVIGDVYMARALCFKWRDTIGRTPVESPPAGVDYDLWLGPAPARDFTRNRFHYNWHWFWDYGNGEIGNQAIHELDVARWGLGVRYPVFVSATGGRVLFDDDGETPNLLTVLYEFPDGNGGKRVLSLDIRPWMTNREAGIRERWNKHTLGNLFYGSKGYLVVSGYSKFATFLGKEQQPGPSASQGGNHFSNFIGAVRSRRSADLAADIEEGAVSSVLVHLANISYRLGRGIRFDAGSFVCPGDEQATALLARDARPPFEIAEPEAAASPTA